MSAALSPKCNSQAPFSSDVQLIPSLAGVNELEVVAGLECQRLADGTPQFKTVDK